LEVALAVATSIAFENEEIDCDCDWDCEPDWGMISIRLEVEPALYYAPLFNPGFLERVVCPMNMM
jgi:hypothetical protein